MTPYDVLEQSERNYRRAKFMAAVGFTCLVLQIIVALFIIGAINGLW